MTDAIERLGDERPDAGAVPIAPKETVAGKSVYYQDIHWFRGLAILFVVGTHSSYVFDWSKHPHAWAFALDLLDDSTVFFVFMSGFLFHTTERRRFTYMEYLARKLRTVISPYLVAIVPALLYAFLRGTHTFDSESLSHLSILQKVGYLILYSGSTMNYALWFIPVIAIFYLASPLLMGIDRTKHAYWVLLLLLPLSLLMHRPSYAWGHNLTLALYFLPVYVIGMLCSRFRGAFLELLDRKLAWVVAVALIAFLAHYFLSSHHGKYTTDEPFEYQSDDTLIDWILLQKVLMTFAILGLVRRVPERIAHPLKLLGDKTFTIYFYHLYVLYVIRWLFGFGMPEITLFGFVVALAVAVAPPYVLGSIVHRLWPRWSRSLVGS